MENWKDGVNFAVTVCDAEGIVTEMNAKSAAVFGKSGGKSLIGRSLLDCHSEPSRDLIKRMLAGNFSNAYTIEKNGVKKLIYQTPWLKDGKPAGLVELSFEIPPDMPHYARKP
ncbi:MAG: PAS sensor protein [Elusimicrobia bacterium CG_4_10_14_0_2_um_filter_56_8]|nr:MAG: PAS sensor protein [Elusimicrobia bacterium CG1_02_56_21]PJA12989.1 MAG: PAS sensor protein [Elusimicrobia bacterium CG_4_10_14_0_2_um_filter_56_8]